jgi:hypothetical protein
VTALLRVVIPALALSLTGCVSVSTTAPTAVVTSHRAKVIKADRMKDTVVVGKSKREDVIASLGETLAIRFDSGYEIWVYRLSEEVTANRTLAQRMALGNESQSNAEFVILFAPSGLVTKTRLRPAPQPNRTSNTPACAGHASCPDAPLQ